MGAGRRGVVEDSAEEAVAADLADSVAEGSAAAEQVEAGENRGNGVSVDGR